ncbi:50S ribosomal protein L10 [Haloplanus halobius]|uniref:50S ribosomal protein L10 n=1 Tax=Haloplanus halobius TaxID=2934938 RepID=UPI00200F7E32|nr:50S ribosomal protein L10 [Haloplanus sp. XH21]
MSESESVRRTETIPQWKQEEVDELVDFIESYTSVGIVGVAGIPSRQLQNMRRDLHGSADVRMSRNTLLRRALDEVDEGYEQLSGYVYNQVALIGTNDNPFGLFQQLEASKTPAPINAGEVAPNDIVIPEGDTGVDPGPFVGELQQVGAEARIMEGSIQVTADSTVLEAGEAVSTELANVLGELGIEPKEVGLDLRAVFSEGVLFEPDELAIDVDEYRADIESAAAAARNLSVNASYPTARTAGTLLAKAAGNAKSVGLFAAIEDPDLMPDLVSQADSQVRALAAQIDDDEALPEELRGVEAPAAPAEETEEESSDEAEDTEAEPDTDTDDEDDDDGDGAEGLGQMFG